MTENMRMDDRFGRKIEYMRISVTDRCNLRCRYCMPEGVPLSAMEELLTFEEIAETARVAASLGIRFIKLTGGEPLIRRGLPSLVRMLKETEGIEKVTLTTNGTLLEKHLDSLVRAGLDAVNISLDTMDPETYRQITGTDAYEAVLSAIDAATHAGLYTKVNAVSLAAGEEKEAWRDLAELTKDRPLCVRFIELMPIGCGRDFAGISHRELLGRMHETWPDLQADPFPHGFGPAVYYRIPGYRGSIGLISAIHGKFCDSCNRVRLTSKGFLKPCLCYADGADLREILRAALPEEEREELLRAKMRETIFDKPKAHCFEELPAVTERALMSTFGG